MNLMNQMQSARCVEGITELILMIRRRDGLVVMVKIVIVGSTTGVWGIEGNPVQEQNFSVMHAKHRP